MKKLVYPAILALGLIGSGCAVMKGVVKDVAAVIEKAVDVPIGVYTNSVDSAKSLIGK